MLPPHADFGPDCHHQVLLPPEVGGILAPQVGLPFEDLILREFVFRQPVFRAVDQGEQDGILRRMFEFGLACPGIDPCNGVLGIGVDGHVHIMFRLPCQRVDDRQKFADVVRPFGVRTGAKDLLAGFGIHAAVLEPARRPAASRIHAYGRQDGFFARMFPLSAGGGFALVIIIMGKVGRIRFGFGIERLKLRTDKTLHLFLALAPRGEDASFASLPNDVVFLLRHTPILHQVTAGIIPLMVRGYIFVLPSQPKKAQILAPFCWNLYNAVMENIGTYTA